MSELKTMRQKVLEVFPDAFDYEQDGYEAIAKIPSNRGWNFLTVAKLDGGLYQVATRCWSDTGDDLIALLESAEFPEFG